MLSMSLSGKNIVIILNIWFIDILSPGYKIGLYTLTVQIALKSALYLKNAVNCMKNAGKYS